MRAFSPSSSSPSWSHQVCSAIIAEEVKGKLKLRKQSLGYLASSIGQCNAKRRFWSYNLNTSALVVNDGQLPEINPVTKQRRKPRKRKIKEEPVNLIENKKELSSGLDIKDNNPLQQKSTYVMPASILQILEDEDEVSTALASYIAHVSKQAIYLRGRFSIALSGGSVVRVLPKLFHEDDIDWGKWQVCWVDERLVPLDNADSNYKHAMDTFLSNSKVPIDQIHSIEYKSDASSVAKDYDELMRNLAGSGVLSLCPSGTFPRFDLILLGVGPDGHIASLFPHSRALAEEKEWVVPVLKSPKFPPQRISLTLPCINAAAHMVFVVTGSSKAEIVQRVLEAPALPGALPAQLVKPSNGQMHWFVDKGAASHLSVDAWGDPKRFPTVMFGDS